MIHIVFDLDDTLYTLYPVFDKALHDFMPNHNLDPHALYRMYREESNHLFHASQSGDITMDEMHRYRAQSTFSRLNITLSSKQADQFQSYYDFHKNNITLEASTINLLQMLKRHHVPMGIITNGEHQKQTKTMTSLKITEYIEPENILISGDFGIDKPDVRIFKHYEARVPDATEFIYIGDSFMHDIVGATRAGWKAIWFNPNKKLPDDTTLSFFEVHSLDALIDMMRNILEI